MAHFFLISICALNTVKGMMKLIMEKKLTKDEFVEKYIELIKMATKAMEENDYKKNNKIIDKSFKMIDEYKESEFFEQALNELLDNELPEIKIASAARLLDYGFSEKKPLKILKKLSKKTKIGILSLDAEMALDIYYSKKNKS